MSNKSRSPTVMAPTYLPVKEVCQIVGLSEYQLRQGCKSGRIPHAMFGRQYLIDLNRFLQQLDQSKQNV